MNSLSYFNKSLTFSTAKHSSVFPCLKRYINSINDEAKRQSDLFDKEQKRQREGVGRIVKIDIEYEGPPDNAVFVMNKNISTPYDCAKHIGEKFTSRSAVALLNGESLWHMHKPLPDSCKLQFLHYHSSNPASVNKAFWRTCSFLLGAVVSNAFKADVLTQLHSFPSPNVKSGSFVYDVQLSLDNWQPTTRELKTLSVDMIKFCRENHIIETLDVDKNFALELFKNNPHKTEQIPDIASHNKEKVTLFRAGHHIDISRGPMIPNTEHIGRMSVANVIKLDTDIKGGPIYRFQGVALPSAITLDHYSYSLLEERAKILNTGKIPGQDAIIEDNTFIANVSG